MKEIIWKLKKFDELSAAEIYEILRVRQEVFVVEQTCAYQDVDDYDQKAWHLFAMQNEKIVAYCRIFAEQIKYPDASIGRVLTTKSVRGKKLGKILIKFSLDVIFNLLRAKSVRISAQDYLLDFYAGFGFIDTGKKYWEDDIPHSEMFLEK